MNQDTANNELVVTKAGTRCLRMPQRLHLQQPAQSGGGPETSFSIHPIRKPVHARKPDYKTLQHNSLEYVQ